MTVTGDWNPYAARWLWIGCLFTVTLPVSAAGAITGDWDIGLDFAGRQSVATLTLAADPDGSLTGRWGAGRIGNVTFEDSILTFTRTVHWGNEDFVVQYQGTLKNGKLIGTLSGERGDFSANGVRPVLRSPVLGQWLMPDRVDEQDSTGRLVVSETGAGALQAEWFTSRGEHRISNVAYQDGRLTFLCRTSRDNRQRAATYEGTLAGHRLTGHFQDRRGRREANGRRVGARLIGKWVLTTTADMGSRARLLTVYSDLRGRYESFGGELPIDRLTVEGDQVAFRIEMGFGDRTFAMAYQGTLKADTLDGAFTTSKGTRKVLGRRLVEK